MFLLLGAAAVIVVTGTRGAACGLHSATAAGKFGSSRPTYGAGAAMLMVAGAAMLGESTSNSAIDLPLY
jgi:hypothetical protein